MIPFEVKLFGSLALVASIFWSGWEWRDRSADLEMSELQRELAEAQAGLTDALITASLSDQARIAAEEKARTAKGKVITKRIIEYVQTDNAGQCELVNDWVSLHDGAATGTDPAGGQLPAGDPSGITDIEVIQTVSNNYDTCNRAIAQVKEWQAWYARVKAAEVEQRER